MMLKLTFVEYHLMMLLFIIVGLDASTNTKVLKPIYWNTTNSIFKAKGASVNVEIGDKLDVICPMNSTAARRRGDKFFLSFYSVDEESFRTCSTHGQKRLMLCDVPNREKKYTFLFQEIAPNPWGLEFKADKTYYYISTADGTKDGLGQEKGGVCSERNMKIAIKVKEKEDIYTPKLVPVVPPKEIIPKQQKHPKIIPETRFTQEGNPSFVQENEPDSYYDRNGDQNVHTISNDRNNVEIVNGNGLVIGVVLGACAVLFIVLLSFLGYKVYRRRRHDKKYRSPSMTSTRGVGSQGQVTLLPTPGHHQNAVTHLTHHSNGASIHHMGDYRPPPPYDETERLNMDHAGSTVEV